MKAEGKVLINSSELFRVWADALREDGAERDITSLVAVDLNASGSASLVARQKGIFAGDIILDLVRSASGGIESVPRVTDGQSIDRGQTLVELSGPHRGLLSIERTLLNFLQRLCGIATLTRTFVDAVAGTEAKIYDTRKTIPGWRQLDKYAVRCGGGHNHRMGLHDAILIKDNHLAGIPVHRLAAAVFDMLNQAAELNPPPAFVECEVDTLEQFDELLKVIGIDVILLDNFTVDQMREAVARRNALGLKGKLALEASGGVQLDRVRAIAETGVERIAIGAITHSAPALDIGMDIAGSEK